MVHVPEIDALTQARSLKEAERMARSIIAVTLDVAPDSFDVELAVGPVGDLADVSAEAKTVADLRAQAERQEREASARAAALAKRLASQGVSVRDIGAVLSISFQRAQQLVAA
jgi:predicted RNase H-like HicB family nuclease